MTKRTPALLNTIRRHNDVLAEMREILAESNDDYPLPEELPTEISKLKTTHADALLEDVIALDPEEEAEPWMHDPKIRAGIRAVHAIDRCREERNRLQLEEANLLGFVQQRAAAIRFAIAHNLGAYRLDSLI